jgi:hypothetical protein
MLTFANAVLENAVYRLALLILLKGIVSQDWGGLQRCRLKDKRLGPQYFFKLITVPVRHRTF